MNKNIIYLLKDIDDGEIMIGNEKAMFEYAKYLAKYLNDDYSDEDKMKLETLEDALLIIMSKRIIVEKIDINDLDNLYFCVFKKGGRK